MDFPDPTDKDGIMGTGKKNSAHQHACKNGYHNRAVSGGEMSEVKVRFPDQDAYNAHLAELADQHARGMRLAPPLKTRLDAVDQRLDRPRTERARGVLASLLRLGKDPSNLDLRRIASAHGMRSQSVLKVWYRWVLTAERDALRKELEHARQRIADLERGRPPLPHGSFRPR